MMNRKAGGLHPESQRLLWALVYKVPQTLEFANKLPWQQLEQRGLIRRLDDGPMGAERWEATQQGVIELQGYARFLARNGMNCPPN